MIQEIIACKIPIVTVTKIKWGRYHNIAGIYEGAILETDSDLANETIIEAFNNYDSLKNNVNKYSDEVSDSKSSLAKKIIDICGK